MIKLTKEQVKHLPSLEWLFDDGPPGMGRTTLMAYYFIEKAIKTRRRVELFDHYMPRNYAHMDRSIVRTVKHLLEYYYKDYDWKYHQIDNTIEVKLREE